MSPDSKPSSEQHMRSLEPVSLGILRKGPTWSPESSPEVTANQHRHLALLDRLRDEGTLLMSGPIPDGEDFRGFVVLDLQSEDDVRGLFQNDAHMQSRRLTLDVYPWLVSTEALKRLRRRTGSERGSSR